MNMRLTSCCGAFLILTLVITARGADYMIGADLSFLAQAEQRGTQFKENGQAKPGLQIFRDHGYNWIRLRLFHTPSAHRDNMPNNLEYTLNLAKQAKQMGYKFLLCYHYSDSWADPGKQWAPQAWEGKSHEETVQLLQDYTRDTMAALREGGAMPDMVQIGNEITPGMVWPDGRLGDTGPDRNWKNFADLLKAGIRGVDASLNGSPRPLIMIHIDRGGDLRATKYFYGKIKEYGVEYDVVGQSYYPFWHGSLLDLRENLSYIALELNKDVVVVEVAYNWKSTTGNEGYGNRPGPFPESPEGQRDFLEEVHRIVMQTPNNRGKGLFWWEPAVPPGGISRRGLFDDNSNALPAMNVFDKFTLGKLPPAPRGGGGARRGATAPAAAPAP